MRVRLLAVAATAATLATLTTASGDAEARTASATGWTTAIGFEVNPHSIAPGGSVHVRARLHLSQHTHHPRPLANQQLSLEQQNPSGNTWQPVATATTNDNGVVHFTVTPTSTTRYAVFFHGTDKFAASRSRAVTVWVGQPTALSITTSAPAVDPGQPVTVQGVLTQDGQPLAGQSVELRARPAQHRHAFATVATATTASDGTVSFTQSPTADTVYRLMFRHTSTAATSVSPTATVLVRRATSLSIRNDNGTIRGVLFGPRRPLADRAVTLQASPAGTGTWSDVATQQTGARGGVGFPVSPTAPTDYRLIFAGTARFQTCQSGVVTVGNG